MEKRGRQRKKASLPARFGVARPEKLGLITDVSARGVYLSTNAVLSKGSVVHLQVKVPGGDEMRLQGRVMRSRRVQSSFVMLETGGMGVHFEDPPANWRASLSLPDDE